MMNLTKQNVQADEHKRGGAISTVLPGFRLRTIRAARFDFLQKGCVDAERPSGAASVAKRAVIVPNLPELAPQRPLDTL